MSQAAKTNHSSDAQRWQAVLHRDRRADGDFCYAVKTTGIYCRPGCSSRLPKRHHVVFFDHWRAAEREGYRACRKCQPRMATGTPQPPAAVVKACQLIDAADEPPKLNDLAQAVGLSPFYLHRMFKATLGVTPRAYAAGQRTRRLADHLAQGRSVTRAIYAAGFNSTGRCYSQAGAELGMTPARFRNGAAGLRIRYAIGRSYLGCVLVAATDRGICMIALGDSPKALEHALTVRFARAELVRGDAAFSEWVTHVLALIESPGQALGLPLDIQGTAFQRRVWQALRDIPCGQTATYAEIARRVGCPAGARAVAGACASNPVAVAIPCHRVIRNDGQLSGYRWGPKRKRALLDREAKSRGSAS